ncbi:MAG: hypothetical protein JRI36_01435 [Deltaproteobacteria bacterium]|nr:hypothetical protein [Deltaproteobacteria bacterium]
MMSLPNRARHTGTASLRPLPCTTGSVDAVPAKTSAVLFLVVIVALGTIFYKPVFSYDLWVHLKMGEYIVRHGLTLPQTDPLCDPNGRTLVHHEWLSQVLFYLVHRAFGLNGVRILRVLLVSAALGFIFWGALRLSGRLSSALLALFCCAYLFRTRYLIRPELFSLVLLSFFYVRYLTVEKRPGRAGYVAWFVLCVLWINLHPFMILAGIMLAVVIASRMVERYTPAGRFFARSTGGYNPVFLMVLFLAASLMSPQGLHVYAYIFDTTSVVKRYIFEWQPVFDALQSPYLKAVTGGTLSFPWLMKALMIAVIGLFVLVFSLCCAARRPWPLEDLLIGVMMCAMAVKAARFVWLLFIPLVLVLKHGRPWIRALGTPGQKGLVAVILWSGVAVSGGYWLFEGIHRVPYNLTHQIEAINYPTTATRILKQTDLSGRLYNPIEWGGYLAYHLLPYYKPFIDTRSDLHGETKLIHAMMIQFRYPGYKKLLAHYGFDIVLLKKFPGQDRPPLGRRWIRIFDDAASSMYLKANDHNSMNLKKIVAYYKKHDIPFDPEKGFRPAMLQTSDMDGTKHADMQK